MDGVQKNKECQKALFELFSHCCKGPSGEESGECRKAQSPNGEAGGGAGRLNPQMAKLGECRQAKSPKVEPGNAKGQIPQWRSRGMSAGSIPQKWRCGSTPLTHENRSRTKTLLCDLQSIFAAPSPWWQYTFAHQIPSTDSQNQHQPRHRFWRDNPQVQPKRHWVEGWNCSEAGGNAGRPNPQKAKHGECRQAGNKKS